MAERDQPIFPANIEVEQSLLGILLHDNTVYDHIADRLEPQHFSDPLHGEIFEAIGAAVSTGKRADGITLRHQFNGHPALAEGGGGAFLAQLQNSAILSASPLDYTSTLIDLYQRRELMALADQLMADAQVWELDNTAGKLMDDVAGRVFHLAEAGLGSTGEGPRPIGELANEALDQMDEAAARGGALLGQSTGFIDLDEKIGGLEAPDVIILAGRPSMGKTALATKMAFNVAQAQVINPEEGGTVLVYSLEMSSAQIAMRMLSRLSGGLSVHRIRRGYASALERSDLRDDAGAIIDPLPLYIDDQPALTVKQMHIRARRMKRTRGLALVVIDHLGFVTAADKRANKVHQIEESMHEVRIMAKDLQVPVLVLAQLSRAVEQRDDKRPQLSDLRDSGAIEQDADVVLFLYREEYYVRRQGAKKRSGMSKDDQMIAEQAFSEDLGKVAGLAEVIVAKQRNGPPCTVDMYFDGPKMDFTDLQKHQED